jgi:hypothetical protein
MGNLPLLTATPFPVNPLPTNYPLAVANVAAGMVPRFGCMGMGYGVIAVNATTTPPYSLTYTIPFSALVKGAAYSVAVSAWNGVFSDFGVDLVAQPPALVLAPTPAPIPGLHVERGGNASLQVSWLPPTNLPNVAILGYKVEWDTASGVSEVQSVSLGVPVGNSAPLRAPLRCLWGGPPPPPSTPPPHPLTLPPPSLPSPHWDPCWCPPSRPSPLP